MSKIVTHWGAQPFAFGYDSEVYVWFGADFLTITIGAGLAGTPYFGFGDYRF